MNYEQFLKSIKSTSLYQQVAKHKIIKYQAICGYKVFHSWREIDKKITYDFFIYLKRNMSIGATRITLNDIIKFVFTSLSSSSTEESIKEHVESILTDMNELKISGVSGLTKKVCGMKPY